MSQLLVILLPLKLPCWKWTKGLSKRMVVFQTLRSAFVHFEDARFRGFTGKPKGTYRHHFGFPLQKWYCTRSREFGGLAAMSAVCSEEMKI